MAVTESVLRAKEGFGIGVDGPVWLKSAGAPGGDTGPQDAAIISSLCTDVTNGYLYCKNVTGSGADKWLRLVSQVDIEAAQLALSTREPVLVTCHTVYANIAAAVAAANVGDTVDGVTIADEDRILFDGLTTGNKNVFLVSGSTGDWTFTEEASTATKGDALFVQDGTDAGKQMMFDGTNWVQYGGVPNTESTVTVDNTISTLDSCSVDDYSVVSWIVSGHSQGALTSRYSCRVTALHDGYTESGGADATSVDFTLSEELQVGAVIPGLVIAVDLDGAGTSQTMRLRVSAGATAVIEYKRTSGT